MHRVLFSFPQAHLFSRKVVHSFPCHRAPLCDLICLSHTRVTKKYEEACFCVFSSLSFRSIVCGGVSSERTTLLWQMSLVV